MSSDNPLFSRCSADSAPASQGARAALNAAAPLAAGCPPESGPCSRGKAGLFYEITSAGFALGVFLALVCVGTGVFLAGFEKRIIFSTKEQAT